MTTVRDACFARGLEKGLRRSTVQSYVRIMERLGIADAEPSEISLEGVSERLWAIENPSTRRQACIALRAILRLPVPIPAQVPRTLRVYQQFDLESEIKKVWG